MSIYEALGHRIHVLEEREERAKKTLSELLDTLEKLNQGNPEARAICAPIVRLVRKAIGEFSFPQAADRND